MADELRWTLHVCTECGNAVVDRDPYTPPEFAHYHRHASSVASADIGRNVVRRAMTVVPLTELERVVKERDLALKALGFEDYEQARKAINERVSTQ